MGTRTINRNGISECYMYPGTRIKKTNQTKAEKLAQANARAAKNKSLRARCLGLEARK